MKIWLLENEKRTGPFESFDVRERVSNGELGPDTPAWYDGAEDWVTLADVPSMTSAFPRKDTTFEDLEIIDDNRNIPEVGEPSQQHDQWRKIGVETPEQILNPPRLHPIKRLLARMVDVFLYLIAVTYVKVEQGVDLYQVMTPTQQFLYHLPYVLVDGLLMHIVGTTPGKYVFGVTVRAADGEKLSLGASILRSARVWVIGLGMFTILMPLSFLFSWLISRRFGKFLWDLPRNIQTTATPLQPLKVLAAVVLVWGVAHWLYYHQIPEDQRPKGSLSEQVDEIKRRQQEE